MGWLWGGPAVADDGGEDPRPSVRNRRGRPAPYEPPPASLRFALTAMSRDCEMSNSMLVHIMTRLFSVRRELFLEHMRREVVEALESSPAEELRQSDDDEEMPGLELEWTLGGPTHCRWELDTCSGRAPLVWDQERMNKRNIGGY
eukprot:1694693-Rhodomonas_salina.1